MQEEVRASVVEDQTIRVVAIAATGRLDEEGGSEGWECPHKPGVVCKWRWRSGNKGRGWCKRTCERQSWRRESGKHWTLRKQGAWIKWAKVRERGVTWKDIWKWNADGIKILSQGVYNVLQSQALSASGGGLEEVRASVVEEQTIGIVSIAATGNLDEVGEGLGSESHLERHREVESP